MLLFPDKDEKAKKKKKTFYVLSPSEDVREELNQLLLLSGIHHIEFLNQTLNSLGKASFEESQGVVIDIGDREDVDVVATILQTLIPRGVWSCIIGQSDSISLARAFSQHGIQYYNLNAQSEEFRLAVASGKSLENHRKAVGIGVLGSKGGIGTTAVAWHLARRMVECNNMPTLLVQGNPGTNDLDLVTGKKNQQDIFSVRKKLDAMRWEEGGAPDLDHDIYRSYNFVLFDATINSCEKETVRQMVESSSCLILVLERNLASIRKVLRVQEIIESVNRSLAIPRRVILCLNDSRPVSLSMLAKDEIKGLLGRSVDIHIPYSSSGKPGGKRSLWNKSCPMDELTALVLGKQQKVMASRWANKRSKGTDR